MLTLPNLLTLSRIFAVPILVFLLWRPTPIDYGITFVLYCIVGITDYFDGYLARAQGQISRLGQFLDPIADKIMVAAVLIMLISSRADAGDRVGLSTNWLETSRLIDFPTKTDRIKSFPLARGRA